MIIKRIVVVVACALLLGVVVTAYSYYSWRSDKLSQLGSDSLLLETAAGPVEYRQWGYGGPTILFLHGTPGGYDQYFPPAHIAPSARRVISVSRPGYLRTPLESGGALDEQADTYAALLDALDIDEVIVMGVSGGGPAAITFAANYPERTMGLIAGQAVSQPIGPGCVDDNVIFMDRVAQNDFPSWLMLKLTEWRPELFVSMLISGEENQNRVLSDPAQVERFKNLVASVQIPSKRQAGVTNDACNNHALDLPFSRVMSPTLIIHGTDDGNVPYQFAEQLAANITHADFITIEGGDHFINYTHPEEYSGAIDNFLANLQEQTAEAGNVMSSSED